MLNIKETISELKAKKLTAVRNKEIDYYFKGVKRYGVMIENEAGDILDYEYFNSEKQAIKTIKTLNF